MRNLLNLSMALGLGLGLGLAFLLLPETRALDQESVLQRAAAAVTLTRGPYLQSVTTASVIVVWETDAPASSRVDYGPTAGYGFTVSDTILVAHHALTLTNLNPYSIYHYQISSDGQPLGGDNAFRSAASPTQTAFTFVAYGDTQANDAPHQSVVNRIIALAPNFLLHTGDHVDDGNSDAQWTNFFAIEQNLLRQTPLFSSPGNHENNSAFYFAAFHLPNNERWYSFDYGDAHFVSLQIDGNAAYTSGSPQYIWLENDLANTDRLWKVVFFHFSPYSSGFHGNDSAVQAVRAALPPLFAQHDVDIVFSGHDHDYERSVVSDVVYIVNGGGGGTLRGWYPYNPYSVYFSSTHHCVSITINGNMLTGVGVQPDGTQFDPFTIIKPFVRAAFNSSSPDWLGQVTVFTNTTVSSGAPTYLWAFGDGATSTLASPTHTYILPGIYTVALTATIPAKSDAVTATVAVYGPPTASFSASPTVGLRPLTVTFTATVTTTLPGDPSLTYLWRFGDGATSPLSAPTHTYTVTGVYTVTLVASNTAGQGVVTRTNYITIYDPVVADFIAAPRTGAVPLMVVFTNSTSETYTTSLWRFGDGTTSILNSPVYTYTAGGLYTVTLTVSGPAGSSVMTKPAYITVYGPPTASFSASPTVGLRPLTVTFTATVTTTLPGDPSLTYLWRFGDGATSPLSAPTHTYTVAGVYTVTLVVSNAAGQGVVTCTNYITIYDPVVANFVASPRMGAVPLMVVFTNSTSETYTTSLWRFGDGTTSTLNSPVHTYTAGGLYTVTLTVSGPAGSNTVARPGYIVVWEEYDIYLPLILWNTERQIYLPLVFRSAAP